jgi:two-component system, NarL family, nitrate/nitrite response regulator NarL
MKEHNSIRIVIADEQATFRDSLRGSLASERDLIFVGEASDGPSVARLIKQLKCDVLLVSFGLSRGLELQSMNGSIGSPSPVRVVVMMNAIEKAHVVEAFKLGALGIVLKTCSPQVVLESIRSAMAGQYSLASESVAILVEALRENLSHRNGATSPKDYGLTPREMDIIAKIASGRSNKQVGQEFAISERTVKHHLTNIFSKIGVSNRLQLALFAVDHQLMRSSRVTVSGEQPVPEGELE